MQSIVMPVYNGAEWLEETLASILAQTFTGQMELSVYNDGSTVSHFIPPSACAWYPS